MAHTPYPSAQVVQLILGTVVKVFEDFTYHRQLASADGLSVVLEFSANVNGKELKGIDLIQFDAEGKIVDFEVMVRPMSGLQALGDEMGKRLAPYLAAMKGGRDALILDAIVFIACSRIFALGTGKQRLITGVPYAEF